MRSRPLIPGWVTRTFGARASALSRNRVEALAYGLIVVSPLTVYRVSIGVNLSPQRIMLLLLIAALAADVVRRRRALRWPTRPVAIAVLTMIGFFVFELTQLPRSEQPDFAERFLGGYAAGLVIVVVLLLVFDDVRVLRRAVIAFLVSAVIPLMLGVYQLAGASLGFTPTLPFASLLSVDQVFLGNFSTSSAGLAIARVPSTLAAPAFFGEFLTFIALVALSWLLVAEHRRTRLLAICCLLALAMVNLLATFSRSAWILFALGAVLVLWQARRRLVPALFGKGRRWLVPTMAVMCAVLATMLPFAVADVVQAGLDSLDFTERNESSVVERQFAGEVLTLNPGRVDPNSASASTLTHLNLRRNAIELFTEQPLFGVGLGNYGVRTEQVAGVSSAQSYGFTVLAEGGVVGMFLFATMLISLALVARHALRASPQEGDLRALLLGLYVSMILLVINNLLLYDTLYLDTSWIVMALVLAAANVLGRRALRPAWDAV